MELLVTLVLVIWIMLPAYVPNNIAVLAGGGPPIDGGRTLGDNRILGDGKTWRGTIAGIGAGMVVALLLNAVNDPVSSALAAELPIFSWGIIFAFPAGALLGDMAASFVKRRTGRQRGAMFPLVDQLDFVVFALLLGAIIDWQWMSDTFTVGLFILVLVLTPIFHIGTNMIAYQIGVKDEPW